MLFGFNQASYMYNTRGVRPRIDWLTYFLSQEIKPISNGLQAGTCTY